MEKINKHRFDMTTRDFRELGSYLEEALGSIVEKDNGKYKVDNEDTRMLLVLRIVEGMEEWQRKTNKGIELIGEFNVVLKILDKEEKQKRLDEAMDDFEI